MKKILGVAMALGALAAVNARVDAVKDCQCEPECWCKQPVLRHFRWWIPTGHKLS